MECLDYAKYAKQSVQAMSALASKITTQARHRMAAQTIGAQLEAHLADLRKEYGCDQDDIDLAFAADMLTDSNPKGWDK